MSPEYPKREPVGRSSDVYAMGVTAWVALAGRHPWTCVTHGDLMNSILRDRVPALEADCVSPAVGAVILRACSPRPEERFASALDMADALERAALEASDYATQRQVGELVRAASGRDDALRKRPWEHRGLSESDWRAESPTGPDRVPSWPPAPPTPRN